MIATSVSAPRTSTVARFRMTDSWSSAFTNSFDRTGMVASAPSAVFALPAVVIASETARSDRNPPRNHSRTESFGWDEMRFVWTAGAATGAFSVSENFDRWAVISSSMSPICSRIWSWRSSLACGYSALSASSFMRFSRRDMAFSSFLRAFA